MQRAAAACQPGPAFHAECLIAAGQPEEQAECWMGLPGGRELNREEQKDEEEQPGRQACLHPHLHLAWAGHTQNFLSLFLVCLPYQASPAPVCRAFLMPVSGSPWSSESNAKKGRCPRRRKYLDRVEWHTETVPEADHPWG